MVERITRQQLEDKVNELNAQSTKEYFLYWRYGHVSLVDDRHSDITTIGTKTQVYDQIQTIIDYKHREIRS